MKLISELLKDWVNKNFPQKDYEETLKEICSELSSTHEITFLAFNERKKEILFKVENNLKLCDLQFQSFKILNTINLKLKEKQEKQLENIRFQY